MVGESTIPVIAGLAVGIAFVVMFSAIPMPDSLLSDEDLIARYSHLTEVEYFLEKYPDAKAEVNRSPDNEDRLEVSYTVERRIESALDGHTGTNIFAIQVHSEQERLSLYLACEVDQGATFGWAFPDVSAIDELGGACFRGDYPPISPDLPRFPIQ